ncbi:hypothetical protein ACTXMB_15320 [Arthrobacter rhombi]|uniref:hypothetical protein n=1 Tax=Arthrobacter rhombi TaxID=71253 RepID=UPI003FD1A67F
MPTQRLDVIPVEAGSGFHRTQDHNKHHRVQGVNDFRLPGGLSTAVTIRNNRTGDRGATRGYDKFRYKSNNPKALPDDKNTPILQQEPKISQNTPLL